MVELIDAPLPASEQRYVERLPHPALRGVISCVFVQEVSEGSAPYVHRSVPNGSVEVSVLLGSNGPVVTGAQHDPNVSTLEPGAAVVGVRFRPGAANTVLGIPASDLTDRRIELDLVWGGADDALGDRIADATSPREAADRLEEALLRRLMSAPEPDPLVGELVERLQPWRARRVIDQASELFLSARQLRRRCLEAVGYGPKVMHRILRFQAFLALADQTEGAADLAGTALAVGFADQAHLSRECVRLSGLPPRAFLAERAASCLGSHDHAASFLDVRRALALVGAA